MHCCMYSFSCGGNISAENRSIAMHDIDDTTEFGDIPDRFIDIPPKSYPLVITFQKFLMMLDGSIGNSYFDKFHEVRELSHGKTGILRSSALQALIRMKEINYDLFNSFYWPHFNSQLTKKLDPSAVFTEIISHIKGGLRAGEARDGKLSREDYVSLSEGRVSNLSQERRCMIYDIFLDYEKKKLVNGEFDLADLVVDLHRRLRDGSYEGEEMDFVYIDEVQDLTMRQIALFKYICRNFDEGFVFSGDTAQTIARGIDFRFQDIRYLFYKEFLLEIKSDGNDRAKDKGQQRISNIFHLNQNFRTHAGVLKLAQSVIELLYRFFPLSIDVLSPETSLIYGEAPVLLESGNDENAIITIFGNSGNIGGSMVVGFGAEQVILVRDEFAKMEISDHVGKQALVLTIVECKGLEFQDVLLYNFFGTSPLKNQWRVVYDYMKEQNLLDNTAPRSFPSFDKAKHNILCSELKQLYVAITRTRQRLWICENIEEFSRPIFDYWKKLCLVQVRKLDDSLAQAMQVASSKEEWSLRGIKLFNEGNFEMATMCFERAGDTYREKWAKAAGLRAAADRMRGSNSEMSRIVLMEAAEIYETIGRAESAATCFIELKEFQRAGMIYLEKCGDSKLEDAGDCFSLAGCWSLAADVYARGNYFSKCLSVCTNGKFFDMGLQFIQYWKQNATPAVGMAERSQELNEIEQAFLEKCALHYHELKDKRTMMKCVKAFNSMDSIRTFLRTGDYLDELMSLEEESGNYMEAATIARLKGDLRSMMKFVKAFNSMDSIRTFLRTGGYLDELMLLEDESGNFMEAATIANLKGDLIFEADMLGKAGHFKDASRLILLFVLSNSLWASGSKGWPLKKFLQKEELLTKAKMITENKSQDDVLYKSVCMEASVLTNQESSLYQMEQHLSASQRIKNLRVEIFSARKILDVHLQSEPSKYEWEQELVSDLMMHATDTITRNRCSVETLIYFWSFWKENIMNIFKYLRSLETKHGNEYKSYGEFCLDYLGVQRRENNPNTNYQLLNSDAHWLKGIDNRSLQRNGNIVSMDVPHFASAAQSYWSSEVLFVGMKVLEKLEALLKLSIRNSFSLFCQSMAVLHIFEVTKVLMESEFLDQNYHSRALQKFLASSTKHFFDYVFPLDWRKTMAENMIALRGTDLSNNLLKEILIENINRTDKLTYGQIARVVMLVFVSGKLTEELYEMIAKRFNENRPWKGFIDKLKEITGSRFGEVSLVFNLQIALEDTYRDNWRKEVDYVSPHCYVYLVERFLFLVSTCQGHFYTTKSSLVEMIICQDWNANSSICSVYSEGFHDFIARFIDQFFFNRGETSDWLMKFGLTSRDCYPLLVLRLVIMLSLVCVNSGKHFRLLSNLLGRSDISSQLPWAFCNTLRGRRNHNFVNVLAEALGTVENSLVMVNLGNDCSQILCPDAIIINMKFIQRREDVLRMLFPKNVKDTQGQVGSVKLETTSCSGSLSPDSNDIGKSALRPSCSNLAGMVDQSLKIGNQNEDGDLQKSYGHFWETFDALKSGEDGKYENATNFTSNAPQIKLKVEIFIRVIEAALTRLNQKNLCDNEGGILFADANSMLDELKQLSIALDASDQELENNISTLGELFQKLRERRPRLQPFLDCMFLQNVEVPKASVASGTQSNSNKEDENKDVESSVSKKGKKVATSASNSKKGKETNKAKENSKSKKGKKGKGGRKK
ncbi:hypothetical protein HHK36_014643 [Tetracentron sinense]|uniref:UvrD-like helicase ATP-binding domain-containing protein n=1 Tax=Tetracentron sinense TaxID=13715 RepID=A0A834Z397_TETSI|nr:hypothetical protein HHK36_014643 [Tetracentron sinense]